MSSEPVVVEPEVVDDEGDDDLEFEELGLHKFDADEEALDEQSLRTTVSNLISITDPTVKTVLPVLQQAIRDRRAQYVDVFTEFGGNSSALIDGDALLAFALSDKLYDNDHGGQPLHLVFAAMKFLEDLASRDARFAVVFFQRNHSLWNPSQQTLRLVLLAHLQANTNVPLFADFQDCFDPSFRTFLSATLPSFAMIQMSSTGNEELDTSCIVYSIWLLNYGLPLINFSRSELELRGPKLFGFVADPFHRQLESAALSVCSTIIEKFEPTVFGTEDSSTNLDQAQLRFLVCERAVASLKQAPCFENAVFRNQLRAFAVHVAFLEDLGLYQRISKWDSLPEDIPEISDLSVFWREMGPAIGCALKECLPIASNSSVADLWDGRLMTSVLLQACKKSVTTTSQLGLSRQTTSKLEQVLNQIGGDLKLVSNSSSKASLSGLEESSSSDTCHLTAVEDDFVNLLKADVSELESNESFIHSHPSGAHWHTASPSNESDYLSALELKTHNKETYGNLQKLHELFKREAFHMQNRREAELISTFERLMEPIREDATPYAKQIDACFKNRDFQGIQKLLRRRNKYDPQRIEDLLKARLMAFSQTLIGGPIQPLTITQQAQEEASVDNTATTGRSRQVHAHQKNQVTITRADLLRLENFQKSSQSQYETLISTVDSVKERSKTDARKGRFVNAWKNLDDYSSRCQNTWKTLRGDYNSVIQPIVDKLSSLRNFRQATARDAREAYDKIEADQVLNKLKLLVFDIRNFRLCFVTELWWEKKVERVSGGGTSSKETEEYSAAIMLSNAIELAGEVKEYLSISPDQCRVILKSIAGIFLKAGFGADIKFIVEEFGLSEQDVPEEGAVIDRPGQTFADFQLAAMGPYYPRRKNEADARTHGHFNPDPWQVKLLNVVDTHQSALVSAPTSSGKTFISFYAMEQVLKEDSDGIIVYVSPTKALVNQVEAEIHARFSKSYEYGNRNLCGVFTTDRRDSVESAQILVCVPSCLELLLLSPQHQQWRNRLKWVVFDEVHRISMEGGEVWERLLLAIHCPFLALSATIGNPEAIQDWLRDVEKSRDRTLTVIIHKERFNDIKPILYDTVTRSTKSFNPASLLSIQVLNSLGFPPELKLLPEHCQQLSVLLHDAIPELQTCLEGDALQSILSAINSVGTGATFMEKTTVVDVPRALEFEGQVKKCVVEFAAAAPQVLQQCVLDRLKSDLDGVGFEKDVMDLVHTTELLDFLKNVDAFEEQEMRLLPAILFHLNIHGCERLVTALTRLLEALQIRTEIDTFCRHRLGKDIDASERQTVTSFLNDEDWRQMALHAFAPDVRPPALAKDKHEKLKNICLELKIRKEAYFSETLQTIREHNKKEWEEYQRFRQKNPGTRPEDFGVDLQDYKPWEEGYVNPDFCLAANPVTPKEIRAVNNNKEIRGVKSVFVRALRRGIGLHHSDLPRPYKNAVERLFRKKSLRVVVATATLSLGINMPCRSAVILGDSRYLNPQEFVQMSGRAGRRGFDRRGYVVMFGVSQDKMARLYTAPLPSLVGNVPISTSLILRLLDLVKSSAPGASRESAGKVVERLLSHPFYIRNDQESKRQLRVLARFLVEYLLNMGMLETKEESAPIEADPQPKIENEQEGESSPTKPQDDEEDEEDGNESAPDDWDADDTPDEWDDDDDEEEEQEETSNAQENSSHQDTDTKDEAVVPQPKMIRCLKENELASLCRHLFFMEPYNLLFVQLLQHNVFDDICQSDDDEETRNKKLLLILSRLINPIPVSTLLEAEAHPDCHVVLPALPDAVKALIDDHAETALKLFSSYTAYCASESQHAQLPASTSASFEVEKDVDGAGMAQELAKQAPRANIRSPFVCLSGHGREFSDLNDLLTSASGIYLDRAMIPAFDRIHMPINAYAYDFFCHSQPDLLVRYNGIRYSQLYDTLLNFSKSLRVIAAALQRRASSETEKNVASCFQGLSREFQTRFQEAMSYN